MMNRDQYVQKMKEQLDQWNAEAAKWEAKAQEAQASMKAEYEKQLNTLNSRRDAFRMKTWNCVSEIA